MAQTAELNVSILKEDAKITIQAENIGGKQYTIKLVGVQAKSAEGASMEVIGNDTVLTPNAAMVFVSM